MVASIADRILGLHGWVAALVIFAVPALEASAFVGFVFPGEIAVLLGGVLAFQHRIPLAVALVAAIAGAVIGDTIGYEIGRHHGRRLLDGTVGRLVRHEHLDRAEHYLAERGGRAVFLGRFTAALRVLIPGLAGMAGLRYRTFLAYNAAGGVLWAGGFVLAGYFAGSSWRRVEHVAGRASLVLALLVVLVAAVVLAARWAARHPERLHGLVDRLGLVRLANRFPRPVAFLRRRVQPGEARGLSLTLGLAALVAAGWAFGALTQDVIAGDDAAHLDRPVLDWFVDHREPWLTTVLRGVTVLGSSEFLVPFVIAVGLVLWYTRRSPVPLGYLLACYVGAELLFRIVKELARRPRPPAHLAVTHFGGFAFPSGHATLATAVWGAAALTLSATTTWTRRTAVVAGAAVVALTVGVTRLYLGAHWLTDVLAGWALGAAWLVVATLSIRAAVTPAADREEAAPEDGAEGRPARGATGQDGGMASTPPPTVRPATPDDLGAVAALTAGHRARLAAASPRWWGQAPDADRLHRLWLGHLITADGPRFRVVEAGGEVRGCAVVLDQGTHWFLDDLAVGTDGDWAGAGAALLAAVVEAPVLTCLAPTDGARGAALRRAGLAPASCVWIGDAAAADLPPGVGPLGAEGQLPASAPHTFGPLDPGAAGALALADEEGGVVTGSPPVTAPPIYAGGGTVCIVDRLAGPDPARLVRAAVAAAGTRGDALVAIVAPAPDGDLAAVLDAAGFTPTVDIYRRG